MAAGKEHWTQGKCSDGCRGLAKRGPVPPVALRLMPSPEAPETDSFECGAKVGIAPIHDKSEETSPAIPIVPIPRKVEAPGDHEPPCQPSPIPSMMIYDAPVSMTQDPKGTTRTAFLHREVEVSMVIRRVFDINMIKQTFGAELKITMAWDLPPSEKPPPPEEDDGDWEPEWSPKYRIFQVILETFHRVQFTTQMQGGRKMVIMEVEHLVTIQEELELRHFPADCQDLTIELYSRLPQDKVEWVPSKVLPFVKLTANKCLLNDFKLMTEIPFSTAMKKVQKSSGVCSAIIVKVKVARQSDYYIVNVVFIMSLICSFAICSYSLHPADIEGRIGIDFNLLLTAVAFKYVLVEMLPSLSYVTLLDKYVLGGFLFLAAVTTSHAVVPHYYITHDEISPLTMPPLSHDLEEDLIYADNVSMNIFISAWSFWNIAYFLYYIWRKRHEYHKFTAVAWKEQEGTDSSTDGETDDTSLMVQMRGDQVVIQEECRGNTRMSAVTSHGLRSVPAS